MSASFNYGISIQEAIKKMREASGKSERIEVRKLAEALLGKGIRLTAFKEESGLCRDVEISAGQVATALVAICEYPLADDPEGYSLESHIVKTGKRSQGDYIEVPVKHLRISRPVLGELLELTDIYPIPKDWIKNSEGSSQRIPSNQKEDAQSVLVECGKEKKKIIPIKAPKKKDGWFDVILDSVKEFEREHNYTPSEAKLWSRLVANPPKDYGISFEGEHLSISGVKPLDRKNFNARYKRYFASQ